MNRESRDTVLFLAPLVSFIVIFLLVPVIGTFWLSLWRDVSFLPREFAGLKNYVRVIKDNQFWQSCGFTLLFTLISVTLEMILGTCVALVIHEPFRGRSTLRGVTLLPWVIPSIIGARIWQLIYRFDYGIANYMIAAVTGTGINWLGAPLSALSSLVVADVWRTTPFVAIIALAGLQAVPEDLYKQGKIDGARPFQRFTRITIPSIKPVLIVALLFRTIDALRVFDVIYVLTGGGPGGSTSSLSLHSYKNFLAGDFGYGSTISFLLFLIAFIIALVFIKVGKFRESTL